MRQTRLLMGMHITIDIIDAHAQQKAIADIYDYFTTIDNRFSTYKETSEISLINKHLISEDEYSEEMQTIFALAEQTKRETNGFFDIYHTGKLDPSGIVKGWAIWQAALLLQKKGYKHFYIDAGGDVQVSGHNAEGNPWIVGIENPFNRRQIVKRLVLHNHGIATSGTAIRGQHIYNPHRPEDKISDIVSLTVIGPNVYEADRFATAAFAMGKEGIYFLEKRPGLEGYMIDRNGVATFTSGFTRYTKKY